MSKYKELVYMVLDELKLASDDSYFTEDHVIFLLNKFRAFLLNLKYSDIRKQIPESNYLSIELLLEKVSSILGECCEGCSYLRTKDKVPNIMKIGTNSLYPIDFYLGTISFISKERMKYVGYNKYLLNIIYASLGPDLHIYLTSRNPLFQYLEKVKFTGIFEDAEEILLIQCNLNNNTCDIMDMNFPIEEGLVSSLILLVVKELAGPSWKPEDNTNNASDDLSNLANFIAKNMKSNLLKKIEE